jgi:hypothetical protein
MIVRHCLAFSACTVALGCGPMVQTTPLNAPTHPLTPRPTESVEVYSSTLPARPHQDVALIQAQESDALGLSAMLQKIREEAAQMGCDAVFIKGTGTHVGAPPGSGWALLDPSADRLYATCIEWLDAPVPAPQAMSPVAPSPATATLVPARSGAVPVAPMPVAATSTVPAPPVKR